MKQRLYALLLPVALLLGLQAVAQAQLFQFKPGDEEQARIGREAAQQVNEEENVLPASDPRVKEVRRIGNRLIAAIPEDERNEAFEYDFNVIESETVNAFALPGGPIYLYTGLLDELDTTDQVAALVAHEMVHVQNEHWASQHADNTKRQLGVGILLGLLGADRNTLNIASVVDQFLVGLPYSRKHENEADAEGLELMVRAGYNPMGAVELFEALKSNTEGSGPPEWMSTHPETDTRINNLREQIDEMDRDFPAQKPRSANKRWRTVQPREDTDDSLLGNRPAA